MKKILFFFILVTFVFYFGCSKKEAQVRTEPIKVEKQKKIPEEMRIFVLDSSHKERPKWASAKYSYQDERYIYFVGGDMDYEDYSIGVETAKNIALLNFSQSIAQKIRAVTSSGQKGDPKSKNTIERLTEEYITTLVDNIKVSGVRVDEVYFKKYVVGSSTIPKYEIFVKIAIDKTAYENAKIDALKELKQRYNGKGSDIEDYLRKLADENKKY